MYKDLDPLLHSQLRLAIMSLLVSKEQSDYKEIKEVTKATSGNISVQLKKLEEAGYLDITKGYQNNYSHTSIKITQKGLLAFEEYVKAIKQYIG